MVIEEIPGNDNESDSFERPDRGDRRGNSTDEQAEGVLEGAIPSLPSDQAAGETTEQRLGGEWPYKIVKNSDDLIALSEWLHELGGRIEKTPIGIAANNQELAFATKEQGWLVPAEAWPVLSSLLHGVLSQALLTERTSPLLITRDTGTLVMGLGRWLGEAYDPGELLSNVVDDMTVLSYATGHDIAHDLPPLKDALDCVVVGPGMMIDAPNFYRQVGMPLARFNPQIRDLTNVEEASHSRWTLTYDWLLFKILAHYTQDPTLIRWLQDGDNPLEKFGEVLDLGQKEATAFLLWLICGQEEGVASRLYPDWASHLPEAPQLLTATHIDKHLPTLKLGLSRLADQHATARRVRTLYGRYSPWGWGLAVPERLHFVIMGSVDDLLDVVVASIIKQGSEVHWLEPEGSTRYSRWLRAKIVGYTREESMEWQRTLEELGALNEPLNMVRLRPRVSVE